MLAAGCGLRLPGGRRSWPLHDVCDLRYGGKRHYFHVVSFPRRGVRQAERAGVSSDICDSRSRCAVSGRPIAVLCLRGGSLWLRALPSGRSFEYVGVSKLGP
jgi:hypothetical protein